MVSIYPMQNAFTTNISSSQSLEPWEMVMVRDDKGKSSHLLSAYFLPVPGAVFELDNHFTFI